MVDVVAEEKNTGVLNPAQINATVRSVTLGDIMFTSDPIQEATARPVRDDSRKLVTSHSTAQI